MSSRRANRERRKQELRHGRKLVERLKGRKRIHSVEPTAAPQPRPARESMSDVMVEFLDPYLDDVGTLQAFERIVDLGVLAWNAALLDEERIREFLEEFAANPAEDPETRRTVTDLLRSLVERKKAHFAGNRRIIRAFKVRDTGSQFGLTVVSSLEHVPER